MTRAQLVVFALVAFIVGWLTGATVQRLAAARADAVLQAEMAEHERQNPITCTKDGDDTVCRWQTKR